MSRSETLEADCVRFYETLQSCSGGYRSLECDGLFVDRGFSQRSPIGSLL
jgi:hypothetical protein